MPELTNTNTESTQAGVKRPASPTTHRLSRSTDRAAAKRVKNDQGNKKGKRGARIIRNCYSESRWRECHPDSADLPAAFGWPAGDKQKEALAELDVYIHEVSEKGVGIATRESLARGERPWFLAVPFTLKGETVRIKTVKHEWGYSQADLLSVSEKSDKRVEPPCKYFGKCSGCHIQHLAYADQLEFKHQVVERAFAHANPVFASVPVNPVWGSPLTLGYRTKLTPHFDIRKGHAARSGSPLRRVMDIEECIIGTGVVQQGMEKARADTKAKMASYERGATLLIRETYVVPDAPLDDTTSVPVNQLVKEFILDPKGWVTDVVGDLKFRFPASSFFQNNNVILPAFTGFVRDELNKWSCELATDSSEKGVLKYLVDAYCGSGLFGIACHEGYDKVLGIEISSESISCANDNAKMNGITNCDFLLGDAAHIFDKVKESPDSTAVIIDPPRKGSSPDFPQTADCLSARAKEVEEKPKAVYRIASIQPFDLFPQTYHVENIVTLVRED
ncbi:S-adenosyl-L-methionine-dependent methyltransferase [Linderina pennispora]|uniref:S-adenosyl-L-methionine-dependent methyltransferase n=1 Tax=Linderina pennispora TaxID=61395 RepID=A0A1Y1W2Q4_9FUNG|nr:S-adenosyl-L-methionine-dependent methyltransferase [Linderina pennispora]ORX67831.1 S-adenosyl-L-methionine-dependent methyltransferase [Linderina pennispora]